MIPGPPRHTQAVISAGIDSLVITIFLVDSIPNFQSLILNHHHQGHKAHKVFTTRGTLFVYFVIFVV
jgi:hypothetical protein